MGRHTRNSVYIGGRDIGNRNRVFLRRNFGRVVQSRRAVVAWAATIAGAMFRRARTLVVGRGFRSQIGIYVFFLLTSSSFGQTPQTVFVRTDVADFDLLIGGQGTGGYSYHVGDDVAETASALQSAYGVTVAPQNDMFGNAGLVLAFSYDDGVVPWSVSNVHYAGASSQPFYYGMPSTWDDGPEDGSWPDSSGYSWDVIHPWDATEWQDGDDDGDGTPNQFDDQPYDDSIATFNGQPYVPDDGGGDGGGDDGGDDEGGGGDQTLVQHWCATIVEWINAALVHVVGIVVSAIAAYFAWRVVARGIAWIYWSVADANGNYLEDTVWDHHFPLRYRYYNDRSVREEDDFGHVTYYTAREWESFA